MAWIFSVLVWSERASAIKPTIPQRARAQKREVKCPDRRRGLACLQFPATKAEGFQKSGKRPVVRELWAEAFPRILLIEPVLFGKIMNQHRTSG